MTPYRSVALAVATLVWLSCGADKRGQRQPHQASSAATVSGRVLTAEGHPAADATVVVVAADDPAPIAQTTTDSLGRFAITAPPGRYVAILTHSAGLPDRQTFEAPNANVSIRMPSGPTQHRVVCTRDQNGRALARKLVRLEAENAYFAVTGRDGCAHLALRADEHYWVVVEDGKFKSLYDRVRYDETEHVTLTVYERESLRIPPGEEALAALGSLAVELKAPSDLQSLGVVWAQAKVVGLGEGTHGTHEFFELNGNVVRILVEQFELTDIAIEAAFSEATRLNDFVVYGRGDVEEALAGLHFWTVNTTEMLELLRWVRRINAQRPMNQRVRFWGVDCQYVNVSAEMTIDFLAATGEAPPDLRHQLRLFLEADASEQLQKLTSDEAQTLDARLAQLGRLAASSANAHANDRVATRHIEILRQAVELYTAAPGQERAIARDGAMAANLEWIAGRRPDSKVALIAHNRHISTTKFAGYATLGWHLRSNYGRRYVAWGSYFGRGGVRAKDRRSGATESEPSEIVLERPKPGFAEATFLRIPYSQFYMYFRQSIERPALEWLRRPHEVREIGSLLTGKDWPEVVLLNDFDGIFFVANASPSVLSPTRRKPGS